MWFLTKRIYWTLKHIFRARKAKRLKSNQMFISSSDGPRPSAFCRPPLCIFSAWEIRKWKLNFRNVAIQQKYWHLIKMPGHRISWELLLFSPASPCLSPGHLFQLWGPCRPWWFFLLLSSPWGQLVEEGCGRVRSPFLRGAVPAQQDDRRQEGEEGEASHTGKADDEPDGDAKNCEISNKLLGQTFFLITCTPHSDRLSIPLESIEFWSSYPRRFVW